MLFEILYKLFFGIVATVSAIVSFKIFMNTDSPVLAFLSIIFWVAVTAIHFKLNVGNSNSSNHNLYTEMDKMDQVKKELEFNGFNANNYSNINHAVNDMHAMWDEMD